MNFGDRERVMAPPSTFVGASVAPGAVRGVEASAEPEPASGRAVRRLPFPLRPDRQPQRRRFWMTPRKEADATLASARRAAEKLMSEAAALAAQRRAQAERWSRDHIGDADDVGTKRLLDAQEQARQIIEQARIEARRIRAEPQPDEAPATSAQTDRPRPKQRRPLGDGSRSSSVPSS